MLGTKNWKEKEKKEFYWIELKEQDIEEFYLDPRVYASQRANAQSTKLTSFSLLSSYLYLTNTSSK